jgi:hypothetical protein
MLRLGLQISRGNEHSKEYQNEKADYFKHYGLHNMMRIALRILINAGSRHSTLAT